MKTRTYRRSVVYEIVVTEANVLEEMPTEVRAADLTDDDFEMAADEAWADNGPEISREHYRGTIESIDEGHLEL